MAIDSKEVIHKNAMPMKVILQKTEKGYRWEVSVSGADINSLMADLKALNNRVKAEFSGKGA